ncbi:hypothetical protein SCANM63S_07531 [Streptomyces canarius]
MEEKLLVEHLVRISAACPDNLRGIRDRALVLMHFAVAGREHELAFNRVRDYSAETPAGIQADLRVSKVRLRVVPVPYGSRPSICPVRAWQAWKEAAGPTDPDGYAWRRLHNRWHTVIPRRLHDSTRHRQSARRRDHPSENRWRIPNRCAWSRSWPPWIVSAGRYRRMLRRGTPGPAWGHCPLSPPRTARDLRTPPLPPRRHLRQRPQPPYPAAHRTAQYGTPTRHPAAPSGLLRTDDLRPVLLPHRRHPSARASPVCQPRHHRRGRGHRRRRFAPAPDTAGPCWWTGNQQQGPGRHHAIAVGIGPGHSPSVGLVQPHGPAEEHRPSLRPTCTPPSRPRPSAPRC